MKLSFENWQDLLIGFLINFLDHLVKENDWMGEVVQQPINHWQSWLRTITNNCRNMFTNRSVVGAFLRQDWAKLPYIYNEVVDIYSFIWTPDFFFMKNTFQSYWNRPGNSNFSSQWWLKLNETITSRRSLLVNNEQGSWSYMKITKI